MPQEQDRLMMEEYRIWRELCEQLRATGAVTEEDGNSTKDKLDTPGQRLFAKLREWGAAMRELGPVQRRQDG